MRHLILSVLCLCALNAAAIDESKIPGNWKLVAAKYLRQKYEVSGIFYMTLSPGDSGTWYSREKTILASQFRSPRFNSEKINFHYKGKQLLDITIGTDKMEMKVLSVNANRLYLHGMNKMLDLTFERTQDQLDIASVSTGFLSLAEFFSGSRKEIHITPRIQLNSEQGKFIPVSSTATFYTRIYDSLNMTTSTVKITGLPVSGDTHTHMLNIQPARISAYQGNMNKIYFDATSPNDNYLISIPIENIFKIHYDSHKKEGSFSGGSGCMFLSGAGFVGSLTVFVILLATDPDQTWTVGHVALVTLIAASGATFLASPHAKILDLPPWKITIIK